MTLRLRLVIVLVLLAGVGLVTLGTVTYASQRSFLNERVDQQARAAIPALGRALDAEAGDLPLGLGRGAGGEPGPGPSPGGAEPPSANLPPGTFGQRRSGSGRVEAEVTLSYGEPSLAKPSIPGDLRRGEPRTLSAAGDGPDYRVLSAPTPGGGGTSTVVAVPLAETGETLERLLLVEGLVIGAILVALALGGWLLVRLNLRPLDRMGAGAAAIAAGHLSRRVEPADQRTEVGRLGLALNEMLARLERAFADQRASEERLRRFLADASHELRTPLASIRGYSELFRLGGAEAPGDRTKALRRIEEEATRMGVLVEDLLTLARLDESRERPRSTVDLTALAAEAVADASARDPSRPVTLGASADQAAVRGDGDQLRQVLANLTANALQHTPSGVAIEVSVEVVGGEVVVRVRDHGPGLPKGVGPEEVFGRFWRADSARGRGPAGAGLGLAIVDAVVSLHGGGASAADAEGGGAEFVVRLPAVTGANTGGPLP